MPNTCNITILRYTFYETMRLSLMVSPKLAGNPTYDAYRFRPTHLGKNYIIHRHRADMRLSIDVIILLTLPFIAQGEKQKHKKANGGKGVKAAYEHSLTRDFLVTETKVYPAPEPIEGGPEIIITSEPKPEDVVIYDPLPSDDVVDDDDSDGKVVVIYDPLPSDDIVNDDEGEDVIIYDPLPSDDIVNDDEGEDVIIYDPLPSDDIVDDDDSDANGGNPIEIVDNRPENILPTSTPSLTPSSSLTPSATPSTTPSNTPSSTPSTTPSLTPSATPSATPSTTPSNTPSATPSTTPSATPSQTPSSSPSVIVSSFQEVLVANVDSGSADKQRSTDDMIEQETSAILIAGAIASFVAIGYVAMKARCKQIRMRDMPEDITIFSGDSIHQLGIERRTSYRPEMFIESGRLISEV